MRMERPIPFLSLVTGSLLLWTQSSTDAWARIPRPYENTGVVRTMDVPHQTLVLEAPAKSRSGVGAARKKPTDFVFTRETAFLRRHRVIQPHEVKPGERVKVFYRYAKRGKPFLTAVDVQ